MNSPDTFILILIVLTIIGVLGAFCCVGSSAQHNHYMSQQKHYRELYEIHKAAILEEVKRTQYEQ